jgi:hypothetical protein
MKWRISSINLNFIVVGLAVLLAKLSKGKQDHPTGEGQHKP